jgi:hypothetical protein
MGWFVRAVRSGPDGTAQLAPQDLADVDLVQIVEKVDPARHLFAGGILAPPDHHGGFGELGQLPRKWTLSGVRFSAKPRVAPGVKFNDTDNAILNSAPQAQVPCGTGDTGCRTIGT